LRITLWDTKDYKVRFHNSYLLKDRIGFYDIKWAKDSRSAVVVGETAAIQLKCP